MIKRFAPLAVVSTLVLVYGCTGYNSTDIKDKNKDNTYVYGEKGAPARQLNNKYESDPASADRAAKLREKMFGGGSVILQEGATPAESAAPAQSDTTAAKVNA
jgi:hypothetical protein